LILVIQYRYMSMLILSTLNDTNAYCSISFLIWAGYQGDTSARFERRDHCGPRAL